MRPVHHFVVFACLALAVIISGCTTTSSSSSDSQPSGPAGGVEFTVSPSSVSWAPLEPPGTFSTYCGSASQTTFGPFVWTLRETRGGRVSVTAFSARATATGGAQISNLTDLIGLLSSVMTGASGTSITLGPNQTFTSPERFTCQPSQPGAGFPIYFGGSSVLYTVSGQDSNGTAVTSSATLDIQRVF